MTKKKISISKLLALHREHVTSRIDACACGTREDFNRANRAQDAYEKALAIFKKAHGDDDRDDDGDDIYGERCAPDCPGWAIFNEFEPRGPEIQRCDSCGRYSTDEQAAASPTAQTALARAKADAIIRDLLDWAQGMGTWEAPVWRRAEAFVRSRR